jgi:hypothetical protein
MATMLKETLLRFNKPLVQIEWVLIVTNIILGAFVVIQQRTDNFLPPTSNLGIILNDYQVVLAAYLALGLTSLVHAYFLLSPKKFFRDRSYIAMIYAVLYMFTTIILLLAIGFNHIMWVDRFSFFWIAGVVYLGLRTQFSHANK